MRKLVGFTLRSISGSFSGRSYTTQFAKPLSTNAPSGDRIGNESIHEFEQRVFGGTSGRDSASEAFFQNLDKFGKAPNRPGSGMNQVNGSFMDALNESQNSLDDGMDEKLKNQAAYFEFDPDETYREDYAFRPDMSFQPGSTYEVKDLDLTKPRFRKPPKRYEFQVTTEEALRKADFRNVRFLANFITEAGILKKRSMTGISAKAQRKIAREIKTARAFGLMPFTTMGKKSFVFGTNMENFPEDYEYVNSRGRTVDDAIEKDHDEYVNSGDLTVDDAIEKGLDDA